MTSQARTEANQKNAQKSTGPRSAEGKAHSRLNGLKHGMRAETIVLSTEDPVEFAAELQAWTEDWRPPTAARKILVERGAVAAWRLRRSVRVETERLEALGRQAVACYDQALDAQIAQGKRWLKGDPEKALAVLNQSYEGVVAQMAMWQTLADLATTPESWSSIEVHHAKMLNLLGWTQAQDPHVGAAGDCSWRLLAFNNDRLDDPQGRLTLDEATSLVARLRIFFLDEVETLRSSLAGLPSPESVRSRVAESAYLDASPEGKCLMRYEAQHDRSLRATITQLMQLTKTGADLTGWQDEAPSEPNEAVSAEQGISSAQSKPCEEAPRSESRDPREAIAPSEPKDEPLISPPIRSDRDRGGRVWPISDGTEPEIEQSYRQ